MVSEPSGNVKSCGIEALHDVALHDVALTKTWSHIGKMRRNPHRVSDL
jgi:hypothetical protein